MSLLTETHHTPADTKAQAVAATRTGEGERLRGGEEEKGRGGEAEKRRRGEGEKGRSGEAEKGRLEAEGVGFAFHVVELSPKPLTQDILVRLKELVKDGLVKVAASQGELKPGPSIPLRTGFVVSAVE